MGGQHPTSTDQISAWFEAAARHWVVAPTSFSWGGKWSARRRGERHHRVVGAGACTRMPFPRRAGLVYGHTQAT
jgi:hypothetical protein